MINKQDWKEKPFKEKFEIFWKYNKVHVFIWAIGLIVLGFFLFQQFSTPVIIFHGMTLNADNQKTDAADEFINNFYKSYEIDPTSGQTIFKTEYSYYPKNEKKSEENFNSSEYILVQKEKTSLDFIIGPLSAVQDIAYNNMFHDLERYLTDKELDLCRNNFLYIDTDVVNEMAAAFESDKDTSSVTIPDCANPDEMEKPVPVMIDISNCEALAGLYDLDKLEEPLVIAIMTDAPDKKLTLQFIQYLTK